MSKLKEYRQKAYEAGRTFCPKSENENAPCYDDRFHKDFPATAAAMRAWWMGRASVGSAVPAWVNEKN